MRIRISAHTPLRVVQRFVRDHLYEGEDCPACGQRAQVYKRSLNAGMAKALVDIYHAYGRGWVHVSELPLRGGDYAKLRFWGLLVAGMPLRSSEQNASGFWQVTREGEQFLRGEIRVNRYVFTYDNRVFPPPPGFEPEEIFIHEVPEFDYRDLDAFDRNA